jgi:NAD(P)-dependent dehydrogenase (short-subunit alcohol dehydrogenase family)
MNIAEQVVFVSGANRGLGRQLSLELLARGAKVYAGARNPESIDIPGAIPVKLDILNEQQVTEAANVAKDVTVLINNAGSYTGAALLDGDWKDIKLEFDTHVYGTLSMIRAFTPVLTKNGGGTILNILSVLSWFSNGGLGAYSAAKSAEWGMTNNLRLNLKKHNIRVAGLHVGLMDTDMASSFNSPKSNPADIAKVAIDGIANDSFEIIADETSRKVQSLLSGGVATIYPQLS